MLVACFVVRETGERRKSIINDKQNNDANNKQQLK